MKDTITRLCEIWGATTTFGRLMLLAAGTFTVAVDIRIVMLATGPEYVNLVHGSSPTDHKAITDHLKSNQIDFRINDDKQTIEVPAKERARVTMDLMSNGMLNSGKLGYELLKPSGTMADSVVSTNIKRAVEGVMENAIQTFKQISSAKVQLTPGVQNPSASTKHPPGAAIHISLKSGQELSKENVQAIVDLVARHYPGLTTKNIVLTESGGRLLWDGAGIDKR